MRLTFIRTHEPCVLFLQYVYQQLLPQHHAEGMYELHVLYCFLQLKSYHIARLNLPAACLCYNTIYGAEIVR